MIITCEFCGKDVEKCEKDVLKAKHHFCSRDCMQKSKLNKFEVIENYVKIYAKYKEKQYEIIVDKDIFFNKIQPLGVAISVYKETKYKMPYPYFQDKGTRKKIKLHRFIMNAKEGEIIDHISGNVLDNRLQNLRKVDSVQNLQNTNAQRNSKSGVKGVSWCESRKLWRGLVQINGKRKRVIETKDFYKCCEAVEKYRFDAMNEYYQSIFR